MYIDVIKNLLQKILDNIDAGNSNITEDDADKIINCLKEFTNKDEYISKYQACQYMNMARSTFDKYVALGKIPKGKHRAGFKELCWTKRELDACTSLPF